MGRVLGGKQRNSLYLAEAGGKLLWGIKSPTEIPSRDASLTGTTEPGEMKDFSLDDPSISAAHHSALMMLDVKR